MNVQKYSEKERNNLLDEFLTPKELIEACIISGILPKFDASSSFKALDVGSNDGRWGSCLRRYYPNAIIYGIELLDLPKPETFNYWINADFIAYPFETKFDLVFGNIPFTVQEEVVDENGFLVFDKQGKPLKRIVYKAEDFVWKAFEIIKETGFIEFLMRSNFRHSIERYWRNRVVGLPGIHQTHHYEECFNFTRRPSYYKEDKRTKQYGTTKTNAHDNSLFVFSPSWKEEWGKDRQLDWNYTV